MKTQLLIFLKSTKKLLFIAAFFCSFLMAQGQGRQFITTINSNGNTTPFPTLVDTPIGYMNPANRTLKYPLLVFLQGAGEASGTAVNDPAYLAGRYLNKIYNNSSAGGPAYYIAQNQWPDSFANPITGVYSRFIVISPQAPGWSTASNQLKFLINNFIAAGYRVDTSRIYLTGLSAGGQGIMDYATHTGTMPVYRAAAIVPMSMATSATPAGAAIIVADSIKAWGFGQTTTNADVHGISTANEMGYMNAIVPGIARFTNYAGSSPHCCWGSFYTPAYKEVVNGKSMNIYEWMLLNSRSSAAPTPVFTASAGTNQIITLPTSQVTLAGSVIPLAGRLISSYLWSQQSGPSPATITSAGSASTTVTGLAQGVYVFQLKVIDNLSATALSTVQVTVNAAPVVSVPTANAGANQVITLPASQGTLNGTGSTVTGGTISTYAWSQQSGPSAGNITASGAATTTVTALVAGTYVFQLTIKDNNGNTNAATTQVTVNPAVLQPPLTSPSACGGKRIILSINANDKGQWISGQNNNIQPGDTLVVSSKYRWSYLSGDGLHGTASCPIVIINDGGQVEITAGIAFTNTTYLHLTGTGSPGNFYGFYIHSYDSIPAYARGNSIQFSDRSAHIEVDHIDEYLRTYAMWIKEEAQCADSLQYPNWRLDDFSIHDIRARNINQDGIFIGSASPNGERTISCTGKTISPIPMRVSNIHIYNIILDSIGGTGIQIFGGDSGTNEINNCRVTRTGYGFSAAQGSGILLGGYTQGYVHDNYIRNTYQHGISCLGAGLMRVENNDIDSSGYLQGRVNADYSSIAADTRLTTNQGATPAGINSTVYVRNNKVGVSTNRTATIKQPYRSIDIGYGYANLPTWTNNNIICGNVLQDGTTPAEFRINPKIGYSSNCSVVPTQAAISAINSPSLFMDSTNAPSSAGSPFLIYPNPVKDQFIIEINNNYMGNMRIQVIDGAGALRHLYNFKKDQPMSRISLSAGDLLPGAYFIRVQVGTWSDIRKILKL